MYVVRPATTTTASATVGTTASPSSSDSQTLRFKQVEALRDRFPSLVELHPGIVYDIRQPNGLTFRVVLPTGFPHEAPQLQVIPRIQNPLVAEDGRVLSQAHDKLQHWSIHTDLGRVVSEIVDSLSTTRSSLHPISQSNHSAPIVMGVPVIAPSTSVYTYPPPQPKTTSLPTLPAWQSSPSVVLPPPPSYASSVKGTPANTTISVSAVPPITSHFPELEGKSALELEDLLNDPREFDAFFEQLDVVKKIRNIRDELRDANQALAKENVLKGDEIATLKFIIEEKKVEFNEKRQVYEKKKEQQKELAMRFRPERLAEELKRAADETERESDELANAFLEGQLELKEFVKLYLPKRILLHQRSTKRDGLLLSLKS